MGDLIFEARGASYRYPGARVDALADVHLAVPAGALVGIVGPNGCGKTTLLGLLLGTRRPTAGTALALGRPASEWRRRDLARRVAVVAQREEPTFPLRVRDAVSLGRYPHVGPYRPFAEADHAAVQAALERADALHLADRWTQTLSGGEWQRVRIARALAQAPEVLVLDEATANLDLRHEMETFELVTDLVRSQGLTGVLVTHHVNLVARFVDVLAVIDGGHVVAAGPPAEVLRRDIVERVFAWPVEITDWRGVPQIVPLMKRGEMAGRAEEQRGNAAARQHEQGAQHGRDGQRGSEDQRG
ncbi:MAG: ABC transporter ATP-binding protein [Gemmatimonadota bacterium]|nr:ABC transporter ATP-binding protein [Gemmatimonadota bacterium]MDH4350718.1 ABC transporter ATP-binding protein [Gemmatimonadota bacterium]